MDWKTKIAGRAMTGCLLGNLQGFQDERMVHSIQFGINEIDALIEQLQNLKEMAINRERNIEPIR
jgi:hypothetical protein